METFYIEKDATFFANFIEFCEKYCGFPFSQLTSEEKAELMKEYENSFRKSPFYD